MVGELYAYMHRTDDEILSNDDHVVLYTHLIGQTDNTIVSCRCLVNPQVCAQLLLLLLLLSLLLFKPQQSGAGCARSPRPSKRNNRTSTQKPTTVFRVPKNENIYNTDDDIISVCATRCSPKYECLMIRDINI